MSDDIVGADEAEPRLLLAPEQGKLSLRLTGPNAPGAICVDFDSGANAWRHRHHAQPEALLRAAGIKRGQSVPVLDATGGLGQDAFVFASAGSPVTVVERSPVLHAMLADGIARALASADPRTVEAAARLTLLHGDSATLDVALLGKPDVVYLDPMFPPRQKSAQVKKEMVLLQALLGDEPAAEFLPRMLRLARKRVVVKRPRHAPWLEERKPSFTLEGRSSRFDVYTV